MVHMVAINHRADQVGAGIRAAAAQKAWEPVARTGSFEANFPSLYSIEHGLQLGDNNRRKVFRLNACTEYAELIDSHTSDRAMNSSTSSQASTCRWILGKFILGTSCDQVPRNRVFYDRVFFGRELAVSPRALLPRILTMFVILMFGSSESGVW